MAPVESRVRYVESVINFFKANVKAGISPGVTNKPASLGTVSGIAPPDVAIIGKP